MTTAELLTERANQLRTMAKEVEKSASEEHIKQISLSYAAKLITIKPLTNDMSKLYIPVLKLLAETISHEATIMEEESLKASAQNATQLKSVPKTTKLN